MTKEEYQIIHSYPLDLKVAKSKQRIREFVNHFGESGVYVSFSGGKDSTVLLDIVRSEYPNIPAVFCDTGLEFPEVKEVVKQFDNVETIRPKKSFKQVLQKYGYPVISKEQSRYIYEVRNTSSEKLRETRLNGSKYGRYKLSNKWRYLIDSDFKISDKCCYHLKKSPFNSYSKKTGRYSISGMIAEESMLRLNGYIRHGCNIFEGKNPRCTPLGFWKESDVLEYLISHDLPIAKCYGEIKQKDNGEYYIDGQDRTGCMFCAYGVHLEKTPNRFDMLAKLHPNIYRYCIGGGTSTNGNWEPDNKGLGFCHVLDTIGVTYPPYENKDAMLDSYKSKIERINQGKEKE